MGVNGHHFSAGSRNAVITFSIDSNIADLTSVTMGAYKAPRAGRIQDVTLYSRLIKSANEKLGVKIGSTVVVTEVTVTNGIPLEATVITAADANVFATGDIIKCIMTTGAAGYVTGATCAVGVLFD
jgi:hypothetical protein